ncbi:hypothetical protein [Streptomyces sp. NPDC088400]|uniref:hypothetical protein n=1 Tax=Streptomyces sp. NPDC088400 TaxID=3365861 RepID=UPI003812DF5B
MTPDLLAAGHLLLGEAEPVASAGRALVPRMRRSISVAYERPVTFSTTIPASAFSR